MVDWLATVRLSYFGSGTHVPATNTCTSHVIHPLRTTLLNNERLQNPQVFIFRVVFRKYLKIGPARLRKAETAHVHVDVAN